MNKYILSIIIPTRNRQKYALAAAKQVLSATNNDVQLLIQDNSDTDSLKAEIEAISSLQRIKYNHSPGVFSFVGNFSKAVELADGEYLCIIGDDDGINPEIVTFVNWASANNIEAISPEIKLNYIWPNTGIGYFEKDAGNLMITNFGTGAKLFNTEKEIIKLLNSGGQNYLTYNLVKIYHGIVKKTAMDKVKAITGNYFGGLSPDIFSSIALSLVVKKVLKIDHPLTIPGVCKTSGSGQSATGGHVGRLEDAPHFVGHYEYNWSDLVPRFYCVETIWADSALNALAEMKRADLVEKFNVHSLAAYCLFYHPKFKEQTQSNYLRYCKGQEIKTIEMKKKLALAFMLGPYKGILLKAWKKLIRRKGFVEKYEEVNSIEDAEKVFYNYRTGKKLTIHNTIRVLEAGSKVSNH